MSPGEITACYRLYAAHRRSNEICAFPEAILAMNDVGASAELAVLLRLHTGLEGLRHKIGHALAPRSQTVRGQNPRSLERA
jgi:hypothetical protein